MRAPTSIAVCCLALSSLVLHGCGEASETPDELTRFEVTVESLAPNYPYFASGVFETPVGASEPGLLLPGASYSVSFHAAPGMRLSFACMFTPSNDLFFAPTGGGIALFDASGQPRSGDLSAEVELWDAGTEIDEDLGLGSAQEPSQTAPNTGDADPNPVVRLASESYADLPPISSLIAVSLSAEPGNAFTLTITNLSDDQTLMKSDGTTSAVPIAPGVFVIHGVPNALFTQGEALPGLGLEALAEDGDPSALLASLGSDANSGTFGGMYGQDLIPLTPGGAFMFEFEAKPGERLTFASMFAQSNDLFLALEPGGVAVFDADGTPLSLQLGAEIQLWDLGTEINEYPGAGPNQAPRQSGHDTGPDEGGVVRLVDDGYAYPAASELVRVTIAPK